MTAEQLRAVAHQRPFKPFRVLLANGERIEIKRTLRTSIADDRVAFGTEEDAQTGLARRLRLIALRDIESAEVL
jgi:hypothetical protein